MAIENHVILSEVEESPVFSIGRGVEAFSSSFARTLRWPDGIVNLYPCRQNANDVGRQECLPHLQTGFLSMTVWEKI